MRSVGIEFHMLDWKNIESFKSAEHYINLEELICQAIWSGKAAIYLEPRFARPDIRGFVLPYSLLYLIDRDSLDVWRLQQPGEKFHGEFLKMGKAKKNPEFLPIVPEKEPFNLGWYVDVIPELYDTDLVMRREKAPWTKLVPWLKSRRDF